MVVFGKLEEEERKNHFKVVKMRTHLIVFVGKPIKCKTIYLEAINVLTIHRQTIKVHTTFQ
jgi:hypothetical protein